MMGAEDEITVYVCFLSVSQSWMDDKKGGNC
jgi:hypothetical protein